MLRWCECRLRSVELQDYVLCGTILSRLGWIVLYLSCSVVTYVYHHCTAAADTMEDEIICECAKIGLCVGLGMPMVVA